MLDTNAVLDWLLFRDPGMDSIGAAITTGHARWIATAAMRGEFEHVLGRGLASSRNVDPAGFAQMWARHCTLHAPAPPAPARLRCSDADDQKFIDLALTSAARWLISRDRAVLKLRRCAAVAGLAIVPPSRWRPS